MATDSSSTAYGRPKTPKSTAGALGIGMPGSAGLVDEPISTISGGKEASGFDVYPPSQGSVSTDGAGAGGGFAYSTTLRRQASSDYVAGKARSRSPVAYRDHEYAGYGRGRSASLREDILEEAEPGVLGRVANTIRRAVGGVDAEYRPITANGEDGHGEGGTKGKETPSAVYAHKSIDVRHFREIRMLREWGTTSRTAVYVEADRAGNDKRLFHQSHRRLEQYPTRISRRTVWPE